MASTQKQTQQLVSFQQAISDSPEFHAILQKAEDDVEKLSSWMEMFCKYLRSFVEELLRKWLLLRFIHLYLKLIIIYHIKAITNQQTN